MRINFPNTRIADLLALTALLAVLFCVGLGDRPYSAPSEARYIEIGREMAESGDYVTPRLNYVKYFEKPPLFYWVQALSTKLVGFDTFDARLPTVAFAVALCLLTYGLGYMLYGRLAGWLSALILGTSIYLFALSRVVLLDVPVSFFIVATLTAFLYAADTPESRKRTWVIYLMYAAAAGAVLTKGLIGAVLPGIIIFIWLACTKRWALLKQMRIISGTVVFLLIAVPWHVLVAMRNPEWAQFYFIHEHFQRYLTKEAGRYQPVWFFVAVLLAGLFPWLTFIYQAKISALRGFWQKRAEDGRPLFMVIWIAFILIFFSLSDSKLIPYIMPIFPPLATMLGRFFAAAWEEKPAPGFKGGMWAFLILLVALAIVPSILRGTLDPSSKAVLALTQGGTELEYLSYLSMLAAAFILVVHIQARTRHVILAMLAAAAVVLHLADGVSAHYDKDAMIKFATVIKSAAKPGDEVAMYQVYYQDMPVYMSERITIVDWKGELEFGSDHEDTSAWMIKDDAFWKRWLKDDHTIFAVMRREAFDRLTKTSSAEKLHLFLISEDGRNLLFMNRNPIEKAPTPEKK